MGIKADQDRIDRLLRTNPVPNQADLDPVARSIEARGKLSDKLRSLDARTGKADAEAKRAEPPQEFYERLRQLVLNLFGYGTQAQIRHQELFAKAEKVRSECNAQRPSKEDFAYTKETAEHQAFKAQKLFTKWKESPSVAQAIEDNRLNKLVSHSTEQTVRNALDKGDAEGARAIVKAGEPAKAVPATTFKPDLDGPRTPKN